MLPTIYLGTLPLLLEGEEPVDGPLGSLDATSFEVIAAYPDWRGSLADIGIKKLTKLPSALFPDYHSMWVNDYKLKDISPGKVRVAVSCLGLMQDTLKKKNLLTAATTRISIGPKDTEKSPTHDSDGNPIEEDLDGWVVDPATGVLIPRQDYPGIIIEGVSTPGYPAWSLASPRFTIKSTYFTTTRPDHTMAGLNIAPPLEEIEIPPDQFASDVWQALEYRRNSPNGWVLDNREIDELFVGSPDPEGPLFPPPDRNYPWPYGLWAVVDTVSYYQYQDPM